jgi:energy-coupling factor transporter transmembrane protein EcfT
MESRAFGASSSRTNLYELKMDKSDYGVLALSLIAITIALYVRFYLPPFRPLLPPATLI